MPQSIRRRLPAASIRYLEPVTVPAAPRKVSLGIGVSLYRREWRSQCVGIQKVLKIKRQREVFEGKNGKNTGEKKPGEMTTQRSGVRREAQRKLQDGLHLAEMGRSSAAPLPRDTAQA